MIGKQIIGRDIRGVLAYVSGKEGARRIAGNVAGESVDQMVAEFRVSERLNRDVGRTVYHASLTAAPEDEISDRTWRRIAARYLDGMGFGENQYVAYQHTDTDDAHIHIIASRIRLTDGTCVSDSWNYCRSEVLLRTIEAEYDLTPVLSSRDLRERALTTGEVRLARRTGAESARAILQREVRRAMELSQGPKELRDFLAFIGVNVRYRHHGESIVGVSFELDGIAFQGRQLGRDFTWPQIEEALHEGQILSLPEHSKESAEVQCSPDTATTWFQYYRRLEEIVLTHTDAAPQQREVDVAIAVLALHQGRTLHETANIIRSGEREIGQEYIHRVISEALERSRWAGQEREALERGQ